ncbi:hypothetical protein SCP_0901530 [Sparassis crispa]|uniref:Protein kinase domain-containing protein n=1 Tax=Sparassis crispa TaxID=139825 RepID=A0A401GWY4_9APHY|nr:hypothetical protein SCP_0901530 [Sparassis crispa]GBE86274.1 hypothetical protein SCP_0901530 [Sparassis crispa]
MSFTLFLGYLGSHMWQPTWPLSRTHAMHCPRPNVTAFSSPIVLYDSAFAKLKNVLYDLREAQPDCDRGRGTDNYRQSLFRVTFNRKLVRVKFCEAYIERAHRTLADIGLAPKLYFCAQVRGRVNMVIMEFVEGRDAHHQFNGEELPPGVMRDVKLAVEELHRLGLVFGDLRRSNIMIVTKDFHAVKAARTGKQKAALASAGLGAMLIDLTGLGMTVRRSTQHFSMIRERSVGRTVSRLQLRHV